MKYLLKRSLAYMLDCTIVFSLIMVIIQWGIFSHTRHLIGMTNEWFESSINMQMYVLLTISLPVWFYFAYFDSNNSKGTIGKRAMKLYVHDINNDKSIRFGKSFLRTLMKLAPWEIAHIGVIFPSPMYFEVQPELRIFTIIGCVLFVVYILTILLSNQKQSIYDKILGTQVVYKPQ